MLHLPIGALPAKLDLVVAVDRPALFNGLEVRHRHVSCAMQTRPSSRETNRTAIRLPGSCRVYGHQLVRRLREQKCRQAGGRPRKGQCGPPWRPRKGQATEGGRRGAGELLNRALTQLCSRPATGSVVVCWPRRVLAN